MVTHHLDETAKECVRSVSPAEREKIVETMAYTENIEKFMDVLGPFYEFLDIEMPSKKSLVNGGSDDDIVADGDSPIPDNGHARKSKEILSDKYASDSDSENDEFVDPVEVHIDDIKLMKKGITDHNDNDSGFADQVEYSRHRLQNGNGLQFNGDENKNWTGYSNGGNYNGTGLHNVQDFQDLSGTAVKGLVARGGGDEDTGASGSGLPISQRRGNPASDNRGQSLFRDTLNQPGFSGRQNVPVGVGGNGRGGPRSDPHSDNLTEQIAVALLRLQRDMDSVLARLNVLESVALAQHNTVQERFTSHMAMNQIQPSGKSSKRWWPFNEMSCRSFIFFLSWPVILHVIFKILSNRRNRRHLRN